MALILSDDINLNARPVTRYQREDRKLEISNIKGIYFIHLEIYRLFPKINKTRLYC